MKLKSIKIHQPIFLEGLGQLSGTIKISSDENLNGVQSLILDNDNQRVIINSFHSVPMCNVCCYSGFTVLDNKYVDELEAKENAKQIAKETVKLNFKNKK